MAIDLFGTRSAAPLPSEMLIAELRRHLHRLSEKHFNARLVFRLLSVLLQLENHSSPFVARQLGENERTLQRWKRVYLSKGFEGLKEISKRGRPAKLSRQQLDELQSIIEREPDQFGFDSNRWLGKDLKMLILQRFRVNMSLRQCQRMLHKQQKTEGVEAIG